MSLLSPVSPKITLDETIALLSWNLTPGSHPLQIPLATKNASCEVHNSSADQIL